MKAFEQKRVVDAVSDSLKVEEYIGMPHRPPEGITPVPPPTSGHPPMWAPITQEDSGPTPNPLGRKTPILSDEKLVEQLNTTFGALPLVLRGKTKPGHWNSFT